MLKLTQKSFNMLVEGLNHRMTHIEGDVRWMKRIGYYMATLFTGLVIKFIFVS